MNIPSQAIPIGLAVIVVIVILLLVSRSYHKIGADEVGLVTKNFGKKLPQGKLIAEHGEAGYQPDLLMPGWRRKTWPIYKVERTKRVQIPLGAIGVIIAQVGEPLDPGAKTAAYNDAIGDYSDVRQFLANGGQRGIQRPVLPPGTTLPLHPIAFIVATRNETFGTPLSKGTLSTIDSLGRDKLTVTEIKPKDNKDVIGIVTVKDGPPLPSGDIAGRLGGFEDVEAAEEQTDNTPERSDIIQMLLSNKNDRHNNYQDFQAFLRAGGRMGLQHDPLLYGTYLLNPFLVEVEIVDMLVVRQGEVAVIKSYVGLPTEDMSGEDYKFGSIVKPGHRGLWAEPLRTGKYPLNPRIYSPEIVPTSILTLNWAKANSEAHDLDKRLSSIDAKSKEAFSFSIDLQVQIHVPDTRAPKVIGMVGTMQNLVNEVLQSAVGNYFRNSLQKLGATEFIEKRDEVQKNATTYVTEYLNGYDVEVRGVYIQDVVFPPDLVAVMTAREIANQQKSTYAAEQAAEQSRVALEAQKGEADMQVELARARVTVSINQSNAEAAIAEADGQAQVTRTIGEADAARIEVVGKANASAAEALGVAQAEAYTKQKDAIGAEQTALVAMLNEIGKGGVKITPDTVVGENAGGIGGLLTLLMAQGLKGSKSSSAAQQAPISE